MPRTTRSIPSVVLTSLLCLTALSCGDGVGPVPMGEASLVFTGADVVSAAVAPDLAAALAPTGDVPSEAVEGIELVLTRVDLHRTGGSCGVEEPDAGGEEGAQEEGGQEEGGQEEGGQEEGGQEADGGGWQSLTLTEGGTIDLFNLPESGGFEIASGELPAGRYNNLRLFYSSATLRLGAPITIRGTDIPPGDYDLFIPSGAQTGLKVPLGGFCVDAGELETLVVEVLSTASVESIRWNTNGFRISPVLKQRKS